MGHCLCYTNRSRRAWNPRREGIAGLAECLQPISSLPLLFLGGDKNQTRSHFEDSNTRLYTTTDTVASALSLRYVRSTSGTPAVSLNLSESLGTRCTLYIWRKISYMHSRGRAAWDRETRSGSSKSHRPKLSHRVHISDPSPSRPSNPEQRLQIGIELEPDLTSGTYRHVHCVDQAGLETYIHPIGTPPQGHAAAAVNVHHAFSRDLPRSQRKPSIRRD